MTAPTVDIRDPEQLPGVSRATAIDLVARMQALYADAEMRLATDIARRLATGMDSPTWATDKLRQVGQLRRHTETLMGRLSQDTSREVTYAVISAYMRGGQEATKALTQLGMGLPANPDARLQKALDGPRSELTSALTELSKAFPGIGAMMRVSASLALRITGTHLPVLRWAEDSYRQVIAAGALTDVLGGLATRRRASQVAWEKLLSEGITGFTDKAGRRWNLATYVEMATRTGVAQAAVEGHLDRLGDAGLDLVIVSNAPQECQRCRPWEGKILARGGGKTGRHVVRMQSAVSDKWENVPVAGTVDEAIADGLMHPNCRHRFVVYLPGVTKIPFDTEDPEGDAARQHLRHLERQVRKEKLKARAAIDPAAGKQHAAKARGWQEQIREHVEATEHLGIKRKREREQINLGHGPHGTKTIEPPTPPKPTPPKPVPPQPTPPPAPPKAAKKTAPPKAKPPKTKPPAAPKAKPFKDDYAEKRLSTREFLLKEHQDELVLIERQRKGALRIWDDPKYTEAERKAGKANANAFYDDKKESAEFNIAALKNNPDPRLEELQGPLVRVGTPSVARARAHVRDQLDSKIPEKDRTIMGGELDRQAGLATRTAMLLREVRMPKAGTEFAYEYTNTSANSLAYYWPGGAQKQTMWFSPKWISHRHDMEFACQSSSRQGWFTPSGATEHLAGTLAHEYGHHVAASMFHDGRGMPKTRNAQRLLEVVASALRIVINVAASNPFAELDLAVTRNKGTFSSRVSQYGSTNASEFLAEVWQEWSTLGDKARPHIREIALVMRDLAEEGAFE